MSSTKTSPVRKQVRPGSAGGSSTSGEHVRRCKAAYHCIKPSVGDDLESREELTQALRYAGCHPTPAVLQQLWPAGSKQPVTFSAFCDAVYSQAKLTQRGLEELFEALRICEGGAVDLETLATQLTTKGDKLSPSELKLAFDDAPITPTGKLDYREFCQRILQTANEVKLLSERNMELREEQMRINTKTFVVRKRDRTKLSPSRSLDQTDSWDALASKGCLFVESESSIIGHQYTLDVAMPTQVHISVRPTTSRVDTRMCIYREESGRQLVGVTMVEQKYRAWGGRIEPGRYHLVPFTTGCHLKKRGSDNAEPVPLVDVKDNISLTPRFKDVLKSVFDQVDLDSNGLLNRHEFNLFNWRTSGEEVRDEEWGVLEENFHLEDGQLTLASFLDLHQMEAEDNAGDPRELWVTLSQMGFSKSLTQDEACPFLVEVRTEVPGSAALQVSAMKSTGLQMALVGLMMEQAESRALSSGEAKVLLYSYRDDDTAALMVENKAAVPVRVDIDCSGSINCVTHQTSLVWREEIPGKSVMIAHYLMPEVDSLDWTVDCKATLMK